MSLSMYKCIVLVVEYVYSKFIFIIMSTKICMSAFLQLEILIASSPDEHLIWIPLQIA